ncbi:MAG: MBL fold metallo-hydrolase [Cenarchaeum sp. SB0662_bin_33]|nr:MBL fold metallo-hydrolase [Cenarchaeum sp. SB0662_bin_33]
MNVTVLGAAGEVGRSGFLVEEENTKVLMDYGVMFERRGEPPKFPIQVQSRDLNGAIITHAHLDHSGFMPSLYNTGNVEIFATSPTFDLTELLITDMLKLQRREYPFYANHLYNMMRSAKDVPYGDTVRVGPISFELRQSGHVIGGSTILMKAGGKTLFYTGDIKVPGSRLLGPADLDIGPIDLLITESTYSQSEQAPREESERALIDFANEIIDNGGRLFIPSFSVERSQEMLCVLRAHGFKHKIVMDGMALKVNEILLRYPEFHRDPDTFRDAIKSAHSVRHHKDRKNATKDPCVIISPAGMLVGGNAVFYLQELALDKKNGIAMVSYQGENTPGKRLLDEGVVTMDGRDSHVAAAVRQFEFSGHSDSRDLFGMIKNIEGDPQVMTVHGDAEACTTFAQQIQERFGLKAFAGELSQTVTV